MPQNIAAGKAAARPINALDKEIINILTPQTELTVANAEIKQLRELLKTRDTPISNVNPLNRLTAVLKALA